MVYKGNIGTGKIQGASPLQNLLIFNGKTNEQQFPVAKLT